MGRFRDILEHPNEPVPRPVRRGVGAGVLVLIVALFGWAIFKHVATGDLAQSEISAGIDELALALQGEGAPHYDAAEHHFVDAASVSFVSTYPAFLIRTERRLREPKPGGDAQDRIAVAVTAKDFGQAHELVGELARDSPEAAELWEKLLGELELRLK